MTILMLLCLMRPQHNFDTFTNALRQVESSGGKSLIGDGGKTIGPLHISLAAWTDAIEGSGLDWVWEDAFDYDKAKYVALLYFWKWCPRAIRGDDWETCARVWNGGPRGHRKRSTLKYWRQVREAMQDG